MARAGRQFDWGDDILSGSIKSHLAFDFAASVRP